MFDKIAMLYIYVETPLHAGSGSGLTAIDLPLQRERTTQYPMIQGSGIKGKLRSLAEARLRKFEGDQKEELKQQIKIVFGPDTNGAHEHAGALVVGDARLLLFPVRSLEGVYAYITSLNVLSRFKRDLVRAGGSPTWGAPFPQVDKEGALVPARFPSKVTIEEQNGNTPMRSVVLEEFSYQAMEDSRLDAVAEELAGTLAAPEYGYWSNRIKDHLVLLPEEVFRDFTLYGTEIITRVALGETKTVKAGPWTEENLPMDSLLYVPVYATDSRKDGGPPMPASKVLEAVREWTSTYVQLGGDETVGRGIVRLFWQ